MITELAQVVSNHQVAEGIHRIEFRSPIIASTVQPGQFVNILISDECEPLLRRPMSVAARRDEHIQLIYKIVGRGTRAMSSWETGHVVNLLGPLGNGWSIDEHIYPVLLGGGVGIAPILYLHDTFAVRGIDHHLIMGARKRDEHFLDHQPDRRMLLTTDDGSAGIRGTVLDGLKDVLQSQTNSNVCIYGCGPHPMLEALRVFAVDRSLPCQIATEEVMGCGIGICQGCNVEVHPATMSNASVTEPVYKLACIDGPVFWAHELR